MGITKLALLSEFPEEERNEYLEDDSFGKMSVSEVKAILKEKKAVDERVKALEQEKAKTEERLKTLNNKVNGVEKLKAHHSVKMQELKEQLEKEQNNGSEKSKLLQAELDKAKTAYAELETEIQKHRDDIIKEERKLLEEQARKKVEKELSVKYSKQTKEITDLQKQLALAENAGKENMEFGLLLSNMLEVCNKIEVLLNSVKQQGKLEIYNQLNQMFVRQLSKVKAQDTAIIIQN